MECLSQSRTPWTAKDPAYQRHWSKRRCCYDVPAEGGTYRNELVHYNYENGKVVLNLSYQKNDNPVSKRTVSVNECPYDMISMLLKARSFDGSKYKSGMTSFYIKKWFGYVGAYVDKMKDISGFSMAVKKYHESVFDNNLNQEK